MPTVFLDIKCLSVAKKFVLFGHFGRSKTINTFLITYFRNAHKIKVDFRYEF